MIACEQCRFRLCVEGLLGQCRRHAPLPVPGILMVHVPRGFGKVADYQRAKTDHLTIWPITAANDSCGEGARKNCTCTCRCQSA